MKFKFALSLLMGGCSMAAMAQGGYQDGVDYFNADRFEQAKIILDKTLSDKSTDKAVAYYYLGALDMKNKDYKSAKLNFENGMKANPDYGMNYVGLGEIALAKGDVRAAETWFNDALKIDKKDYEVKTAIARAYFNVDPVAYSKEIDKHVANAMKDSKNMGPAVYVLKGDMAKDVNVGEAASYYEQAITYDEQAGDVNPEAYVKYANLYNKVNNSYSIRKLEELRSKLPTSALAQRELAEKYYDSGLFSKAAAEYKTYMANPNHFQRDEQRYCQLLFFDKKYQESLDIAKNVLKQDPENFYMYRMVLVNDAALGNNEEAELYGAKLFNAPGAQLTTNDYNTYGKVLVENGKSAEAIDIYERAYKSDPVKFEQMLVNISDIYSDLGDYKNATDYLKRYVDGGKASLTDKFALAKLYGALAQKSEAGSEERASAIANGVSYIDQALESAKNKAPLYRTKGQMLSLRDGNEVSKEMADTYLAMVNAYTEEDPEAVKKNPQPFKQAYSVLGTYYQKQGDTAQSRAWYEKLYELDPSIPGLKEMLKK